MMNLEIRILSGSLANTTLAYEPIPISVGRAPASGLRFDRTRDLTVSARHALLYPQGERWWLRDLGSQNGTYHNRRRISTPVVLADRDRITFGYGGPEVEVRLAETALQTKGVPAAAHTRTGGGRDRGTAPEHHGRSTGTNSGRVIQVSAAIVVALVTAILYLVTSGERERAAWERERTVWERERSALLARLDSVLLAGQIAVRSLEGQREDLARALSNAQDELRSARAELELALASDNVALIEHLQQQLQARTAALERQQLAALLDFDAIERGNRRAVALVYVERRSGEVVTATAFAARADGILITTGHLVEHDDGRPVARRIGVQFSDSDQVFPARVLRVDAERDLALLRVENLVGEIPVVQGFNVRGDTLGSGAPVAVIGFPLGGSPSDPGGAAQTVRPLVSSGVIAAWREDRVEIVGYGAAGASGSPIFDAHGQVIAILFGGMQRPAGQRIVGVPARDALRLLERAR